MQAQLRNCQRAVDCEWASLGWLRTSLAVSVRNLVGQNLSDQMVSGTSVGLGHVHGWSTSKKTNLFIFTFYTPFYPSRLASPRCWQPPLWTKSPGDGNDGSLLITWRRWLSRHRFPAATFFLFPESATIESDDLTAADLGDRLRPSPNLIPELWSWMVKQILLWLSRLCRLFWRQIWLPPLVRAGACSCWFGARTDLEEMVLREVMVATFLGSDKVRWSSGKGNKDDGKH